MMINKLTNYLILLDCEEKQEKLLQNSKKLSEEESSIIKRQEILKKELYGRFGESINLEN